MKKFKTILAASFMLALAFVFSCSSSDGGGGSGGGGSGGGGSEVSSSSANVNSIVNCDVGGICTQVASAAACTIVGGTVVASCGVSSSSANGNSIVNCDVGGFCTQVASAAACTVVGGTVVPSCGGSSNSNGGDGGSSSSNGNGGGSELTCYMTATSVALGAQISPTPTVYCNAAPVSPSLITWENNPPSKQIGNFPVKATANCGGVKEATCGIIAVTKAYCDRGYPTKDDPIDKCTEIIEVLEGETLCDAPDVGPEYGKLVKSCNSTDRRTDIVYCSWGQVTIYGGGCYRAQENSKTICQEDDGVVVTRCPNNSLGL